MAAPRRHRLPKGVVQRVLAVVVSGLAFYLVLPALARVATAWPRLSTLSPWWLAGCVTFEAASFGCSIGLQRLVLRTKGWFVVTVSALTGNAVTNVLPGGDAAGAAVQYGMLATGGIDPDTAKGGLAAASLLGIGGLLALPLFTLPAVLAGVRVSRGLLNAGLLGLVGFALYTIGMVVVMTTDAPLRVIGRVAQWVWNKLHPRRKKATGLDDRLLAQRNALRSSLGRNWRSAVFLTAGHIGFDYLCLLSALRATGSSPNPSVLLMAYAAAGIIALVPLTPGGLGIVEASLTGLLVLAGVKPGLAVVATLAYRLVQYWLPTLAGVLAYLLFRHRYGRVRVEPPPGAAPAPEEVGARAPPGAGAEPGLGGQSRPSS